MQRVQEGNNWIRACLRPDPKIWHHHEGEEEEEEEPYRTVYIQMHGGAKTFGAMLRENASAKGFHRVMALVSNAEYPRIHTQLSKTCRELRETGSGGVVYQLSESYFKKSSQFYFGKPPQCRHRLVPHVLDVSKTFSGKIYDGMESKFLIVRTKTELDDFAGKWIMKSHPRFKPGVRKIVGYTPSKDPIFTGEAKIDFDKFSLVVVFGQRTVAEVSYYDKSEYHVYWRYDWTKRTSNCYGAALVPKIPSDTKVELRWMLIAPPLSSTRVGLRPMCASRPIRRRVRCAPPLTQAMLDARRRTRVAPVGRQKAPMRRRDPNTTTTRTTLRRSARIAAMNKKRRCVRS